MKKSKITTLSALSMIILGSVASASTTLAKESNVNNKTPQAKIGDSDLPEKIDKGAITVGKVYGTQSKISMQDIVAIDPGHNIELPSGQNMYEIMTADMRLDNRLVWCMNPFRETPASESWGDFQTDFTIAYDKEVNDSTYKLLNYWFAHGGTEYDNADLNNDGNKDDIDHIIMQMLLWANNDLGSNSSLQLDKLQWNNNGAAQNIKENVERLNNELHSGAWDAEYGQTAHDAESSLELVSSDKDKDGNTTYNMKLNITEGYQNHMDSSKITINGVEGAYVMQDGQQVEDGKIDATKEFQVIVPVVPKQAEDKEFTVDFTGDYRKNDAVDYLAGNPKTQNITVFNHQSNKTTQANCVLKSGKVVDAEVRKDILEKGEKIDYEQLNDNDYKATYLLKNKIPSGIKIESLEISDDLEDVLEFVDEKDMKVFMTDSDSTDKTEESDEKAKKKSAKEASESTEQQESKNDDEKLSDITLEGEDVTSEGDFAFDGNKVTWTAKDPQKFEGKTLTLVFQAKIKDGADITPYLENGEIRIPNISHLIVNGNDLTSNKVDVAPTIKEEKPVEKSTAPTAKPSSKETINSTTFSTSKSEEVVDAKEYPKDAPKGTLPQTGTDALKSAGIVSVVTASLGALGYAFYKFFSKKKSGK